MRNGPTAQAIGRAGEEYAADFLIKNGCTIVERNYRIRGGEIDIVARDKNDLVFVEVKTRATSKYGYPEEGVHFFKKKRIAKAIRAYIQSHHISAESYVRFDIIAIEGVGKISDMHVHHIKNIELGEDVF